MAAAAQLSPSSAPSQMPAGPASPSRQADVPDLPLHAAIEEEDADVVKSLLIAGADPNARTAADKTPLKLACSRANAAIARVLMQYGAKLGDGDEVCPQPWAATCGGSGVPGCFANRAAFSVAALLNSSAAVQSLFLALAGRRFTDPAACCSSAGRELGAHAAVRWLQPKRR